jgi:hypothetical protein
VAETATFLEALVVHPGDKLLVRVRQDSSRDAVLEFRTMLEERLPEVQITVIAAEQLAVVRAS